MVANYFADHYREIKQLPGGRPAALLLLFLLLSGRWFQLSLVGAQGQNQITAPEPGAVISGIVAIEGTATDPNFLRYEIAFFQQANAEAGWIVFAQGDQPVIDGRLAVWDTTVGQTAARRVFPDGAYQLRLRVVRQDYNYDEYFVTGLIIANENVTPTATPTITPTLTTETPTPALTSLPAETDAALPDTLPSLTPFPTPTPRATPVNIDLTGEEDGSAVDAQSRTGFFEQLTSVDTGRFGRAFWQGVRIAAYLFGALAIYLLFRGGFRRLWRFILSRLFRDSG